MLPSKRTERFMQILGLGDKRGGCFPGSLFQMTLNHCRRRGCDVKYVKELQLDTKQ